MTYTVTLIPGDGTGPELAAALETVIAATGVPILWEVHDAGLGVMAEYGTPLPEHVLVDAVLRQDFRIGFLGRRVAEEGFPELTTAPEQ